MGATTTAKRPRRAWWQVCLRAAACAALVLLVAYVSLPWWLPTKLVRDRIAAQMSEQIGVPVRIGELSASWSGGVRIKGLSVDNPGGFGDAPMLEVGEIRAEFAPVNFLVNKRLAWMEADGPRLDVLFDKRGNCNLAALAKLRFDVQADCTHVKRATAVLNLPGATQPLLLNVSDLQMLAGRTGRFGNVTMSAELGRAGQEQAPVSLRAVEGGDAQAVASISFNFSRLDLEQLQLPRLAGLPLSKLGGLCDGSLEVQVNREGVVDRFGLNVTAHGLDVQPTSGPSLPAIDEAGVRISAAYDPAYDPLAAGGRVSINSLSLRLPGLELAGQATVFTQILSSNPKAIESVDLTGQIEPERLAALLTGKERLEGDLELAGPVRFGLKVRHKEHEVFLDLDADATDASVARAGRTLKPVGRKLAAGLDGFFDDRNWDFRTRDDGKADGASLSLGGNIFSGHGRIRGMDRIAAHWAAVASVPAAARTALADLAGAELRGEWQITELQSLREALPAVADVLGEIDLSGAAEGGCSVAGGDSTRLSAWLLFGRKTGLAMHGLPVKRAGSELRLDCDALVDREQTGLRDVRFSARHNGASLEAGGATVQIRSDAADANDWSVHADGDLRWRKVEAFLPELLDLRGRLRGDLAGRFEAELGRLLELRRARLWADLDALAVDAGDIFRRPQGQGGAVELELLGGKENKAVAAILLQQASVRIEAQFPDGLAEAAHSARLEATANVGDANWLSAVCPLLRDGLGGGRLAGSLKAHASGGWQTGIIDANVLLDAEDAEYTSGGPVRRVKPAGTEAEASLAFRLEPSGDDIGVRDASGNVSLGGARLGFTGGAELRPVGPGGDSKPPLRQFHLNLQGSGPAEDGGVCSLLPEWADLVAHGKLSGPVSWTAELSGSGDDVSLQAHLDATKASASVGPAPKSGAESQPNEWARFVKPSGTPAELDVKAELSEGLSRLRIDDLKLRLGETRFIGEGSAAIGPDGKAKVNRFRVAGGFADCASLGDLLPGLREYQPAGGADVWLGYDSNRPSTIDCGMMLSGLRARYRGKDVRLNGGLLVRGLRRDANRVLMDKFKTDGLEFAAGENHGWLVAEVTDPTSKPVGEFQLLCEYIDDKDLTDWLEQGLIKKDPLLSPRELGEIERGTAEIIAIGREILADANLVGRVSISHVRSYDAAVKRYYEPRNLMLDFSAIGGQVKAAYEAELNGGSLSDRYAIRWNDDANAVSQLKQSRNLAATENLQPQIARSFPGNTVYGFFNHTQEVTFSLRDLISNILDGRCPRRQTGTGKTVTIDGMVEGRAAPKFIAAILPGLNLAQYRYDKMTAFAKYRPDGSSSNDMIFSGKSYDIYMEGDTDANSWAEYQIGVILLGTPQSPEWNHEWRLGRIPILNIKGRIEDGKLYDEEVWYPWPNETIGAILIKNNPIFVTWLKGR